MTFLTLSYESLVSEMGVAPRLNATSTHKQDTHTLRCTLHGLQGIRQTPLTSTTAVRMRAEGAATAACGGVARGEDLRARYDRDRDPPAHAVGARYTHSSARASGPATKLHGLLDKG